MRAKPPHRRVFMQQRREARQKKASTLCLHGVLPTLDSQKKSDRREVTEPEFSSSSFSIIELIHLTLGVESICLLRIFPYNENRNWLQTGRSVSVSGHSEQATGVGYD